MLGSMVAVELGAGDGVSVAADLSGAAGIGVGVGLLDDVTDGEGVDVGVSTALWRSPVGTPPPGCQNDPAIRITPTAPSSDWRLTDESSGNWILKAFRPPPTIPQIKHASPVPSRTEFIL